MRQIDANKVYTRFLGAAITTIKNAVFYVNVIFMLVGLYGWHKLVFFSIIPNFWLFLALFALLFAIIVVIQYIVLTPAEISFTSRQVRLHDPVVHEFYESHWRRED